LKIKSESSSTDSSSGGENIHNISNFLLIKQNSGNFSNIIKKDFPDINFSIVNNKKEESFKK